MPSEDDLQNDIEKKYRARDKKISKPEMEVTGKSVFNLKKLIEKPHAQLPKRNSSKKK